MEKIVIFLKQFGLLVLLALVGLGLVLYGLWGQLMPPPATVEIIKGSERALVREEIVVDVAGSVEQPGVYTLPAGSRIGDAVVVAGGFSAQADRAWVAQTLNLASELQDAQKVYIPSMEDQKPGKETVGTGQGAGTININTASLAELDGLSGIGAVRAQAIIDNRPYGDLTELMTKAKVPHSVFDKIKDQLSLF